MQTWEEDLNKRDVESFSDASFWFKSFGLAQCYFYLFYFISDQSITSPHFSGRTSHLSLPTLTNAYSDLQLSLEFRPESLDGILLLTGETQEMTGDYLSLLLREGHVELRYVPAMFRSKIFLFFEISFILYS